jgi:uncharacterized Zn finger protein
MNKITSINIVSSRGKVYTVSGLNTPLADPYCDCRGFRYKGECKHIAIAIEKLKETIDEQDNKRKDERV